MFFTKILYAAALAMPAMGQYCYKQKPCPEGYTCQYPDIKPCAKGSAAWFCVGKCVETSPPPKEYPSCGGFRNNPPPCDKPNVCIDDPRKPDSCGMKCDMPGICVEPISCAGITGKQCPKGLTCYDYPNDGCDPKAGGSDCGGICL
jgi:hypothetical protein